MKIAVFAFTDMGRNLANKIIKLKGHEFYISKSKNLKDDFVFADALIFISATGIAVRLIAPFIKSKTSDPAVLVLDDTGHFTISLLSGHLGGANALTLEVANFLQNTAVITTASDNRGMDALDVFAKTNNLIIDNLKDMKNVMSDIVNNKKVGLYSEINAKPKKIDFIETNDFTNTEVDSWVIISSEILKLKSKACFLIPKNLYIGIGCKRNTPLKIIQTAIKNATQKANVDIRGIAEIASIELKKDEKGIVAMAENLGVPFKIYSNDEVNSVSIEEPSDFVYKTTGVYAVSEPCAILSGGKLILRKFKYEGVTISIAKKYDAKEII